MADRGHSRQTIVALAATASAFVGAIVLEIVSYVTLDRYARGLDSLPTVVLEEFPGIDRELLDKFTSFDSELGWSPQPNMEKQKDTGDHLPGEEVRSVVTYSTDEHGSRVCPAKDREPARKPTVNPGTEEDTDADPTVTTYGDSYCFCREVDDDETFQHYLAQELDTHVGNYGGGNYGLDQALMRLKQRYPEDPTDYVIMYVAAPSIARILSVWKHYQEFGNILAVTPRYTMQDGSLEKIETPIDEKEDLLDLESHADFLRENDYHYEHWFKSHRATFPYTTDLLRNPDNVRYALYGALQDVERRFELSLPIDAGARQARTNRRLEQPRVRYHEQLFEEYGDFFSEIVGEFVSYSEEEDFTPVFVMVQHLRYATYEIEHGPIYGDLLDRLDETYPDLMTVDITDHLSPDDDVESLYVQHGEGGHYSAATNEKIAHILADEVFK
jgi:hypothetical protein